MYSQGFVQARAVGQQQTEEWLTQAVRQEQPTLTIETREQAHEVMNFRLQVPKLSPYSSEERERNMRTQVAKMTQDYRNQIDSGAVRPARLAHPDDEGPAEIAIAMSTVKSLLRKKSQGQSLPSYQMQH